MLIDLDVKGRKAVVVGGGREAELKALKLFDTGASTTVIASRFTRGLREMSRKKEVKLVNLEPVSSQTLIRKIQPVVLFVSTGRAPLDEKVASFGRSIGALVCVVDTPRLNDFNMPAIAKVGAIRVAISTGGRSPAVARILRKRIERLVGPQDVLQVELQESVRDLLSGAVTNRSERKRAVYDVINDEEIKSLLREGNLSRARARARRVILSHSRHERNKK